MTQRIITAALSIAVCAMLILAFLKRYSDEERPKKRVCYDCGLYYASDRWIEAVVPDDVWEIINPTYHRGAGLLCIQCMASRCIEAGLKDVPVMFTSGPFVMNEELEPKPDSVPAVDFSALGGGDT